MTTVETYPTLAEAARAMGRDAVYLGGGTIVMRDVNAGTAPARVRADHRPGAARRSAWPATRVDARRGRDDGRRAGAAASSSSCTRWRALIGGPQVRNMATVGGNLFAATSLRRLRRRPSGAGRAASSWRGRAAPRPLDELLRDRGGPGSSPRSRCRARATPRAFGFLKVSPRQAQGRLGPLHRRPAAARGRPHPRRARGLRGDGAGAAARAGGRSACSRASASTPPTIDRRREVAAEGIDPPTDAIATRLVPPRGGGRASAAASRTDGARLMAKKPVTFTLNGSPRAAFADDGQNLLDFLRRGVGDLSPKYGCGQGTCGACTVTVDGGDAALLPRAGRSGRGRARRAPPPASRKARASTRCRSPSWTISPRNAATARPGMLVSARALLDRNPRPTPRGGDRGDLAATSAAAPATSRSSPRSSPSPKGGHAHDRRAA